MADRKQTPDILGEILGEKNVADTFVPPATEAEPGPQVEEARPARRAPIVRPKRERVAAQRWEHCVVSFQDWRGWRPRFVDGEELADWKDGPHIHNYVDQMGDDGWELIAAASGQHMYGTADQYQLFFRRPRR